MQQEKNNIFAIISLVLGILALLTPLLLPPLSLVLGIIAIVLGVIARKKADQYAPPYQKKGFALAGIITGAIGLVFTIILLIVTALFLQAAGDCIGLEGAALEECLLS